MKRITKNVYYTEPLEETDRPTMGYIKGEKYSLMVEAGGSKLVTEDFNSKLNKLGLKEADFVVISHHHWDHSFGIYALNAVSIALDKTNEKLEEMSRWEWSDSLLTKYISEEKFPLFCEPHIRLEYPNLSDITVKIADISFKDEMTLELGNQKCIFKKVTTPHTDDSIIVYVPNEKVVFLGDCVYEELVVDQWIDNKEKLAVLIKELEELDFEYCLEGHRLPKTKENIINELKERL